MTIPFGVQWGTLRDRCEDLPDDATLITPLANNRFRMTGVQDQRIIIEDTDSVDSQPLQREQFESLAERVGDATSADSDGFALGSLDLSDERDRLEREQRTLSRKEHGSANWERQRTVVARQYADIKRKRRDFLHRVSAYYAREYDLVAVEGLNIKGMLESPQNSRNTASASWGEFARMLEYKCEREGTYFVAVRPHGTTKECSQCGVETDKPLWVREHSCPACGFECDRDANAAANILSRGLEDVGVVHPEVTPSETATAAGTGVSSVPASRVMEQGSPGLKHEPVRVSGRPG